MASCLPFREEQSVESGLGGAAFCVFLVSMRGFVYISPLLGSLCIGGLFGTIFCQLCPSKTLEC
jgi:hypothetical protein